MRIKHSLVEGRSQIVVLSGDRRDASVYAAMTFDRPITDVPKEEFAAVLDDMRDVAALNYARKHLPQGYTVSRGGK